MKKKIKKELHNKTVVKTIIKIIAACFIMKEVIGIILYSMGLV